MTPSLVLVVDDDWDAQEILAFVVRSAGLRVKTASNGLEALEAVRAEAPALVLLDLTMPQMDGFTFYSRLRSVPSTRYIPVIVVTAWGRNQVDMLRLPGVTDVVQKGGFLEIDNLRKLVIKTLGVDLPGAASIGT